MLYAIRKLFRTRYLIEINYKSGTRKRFWVYNFKINGGNFVWETVNMDNRPMMMGVDSVESVWQITLKNNFLF